MSFLFNSINIIPLNLNQNIKIEIIPYPDTNINYISFFISNDANINAIVSNPNVSISLVSFFKQKYLIYI
jgi:hypothetical protein